jgi:phosphoribosylanthranilate isomerase
MMSPIRLKICGLRDNIQEVAALQPDYAGFIFYPKSPRYVGENFKMPELDKSINKVGVFVNEPVDRLVVKVRKYKLQYAQLHGTEAPEECQAIRDKGIGIIKAFAMGEHFDFRQLEQYESTIDYFLFDTKTKGYGGSGRSFNWHLLKGYGMKKAYFLSGGISLENMEHLKTIDPQNIHALDVNSRFEVKPGLKDIEKLEELINHIRELNSKY